MPSAPSHQVVVCAAAVTALYNEKKTEHVAYPVFMFVLLSALFVPLSILSSTVSGTWETLPQRDVLSVHAAQPFWHDLLFHGFRGFHGYLATAYPLLFVLLICGGVL
jgi:hypothetical protein